MRLLNVQTLELKEFFDSQIPPYAVLSHTWGDEEVLFQDMCNLNAAVTKKKGFRKIERTCRHAIWDGLDWIWIDTCCIDKTSSAELSEAINSMFKWYENSDECYAYLEDVHTPLNAHGPFKGNDEVLLNSSLRTSRWFTRGWTLQELIAPQQVSLYGADWKFLGTRDSLKGIISEITGIPESVLTTRRWTDELASEQRPWKLFSVAQKMSWAAKRICTRSEDTAYCLLGLFEINMPLLYGEGTRAFVRLQEEIFRSIDDHSLLAWTAPQYDSRVWTKTSALAWSPTCFLNCGRIVSSNEELGDPSTVTKKGLQISLPISDEFSCSSGLKVLFRKHSPSPVSLAMLNCAQQGADSQQRRIFILLVQKRPETSTATSSKRGSGAASLELFDSRCYERLLTPRHFLLDPSLDATLFNSVQYDNLYQTIFLRTRPNLQVSPTSYDYSIFYSEEPVHFHLTGMGLPAYHRREFAEDGTKQRSIPPTFGYAVSSYVCLARMGGVLRAGGDTPYLDHYRTKHSSHRVDRSLLGATYLGTQGKIATYYEGNFILRVVLSNTSGDAGRPPLVAQCRIQRPGPRKRGQFDLQIQIDDGASAAAKARSFGYADIETLDGIVGETSIVVGDQLVVCVRLEAQQTWTFDRWAVPDTKGERLHLYLRFSFHDLSKPDQTPQCAVERGLQAWMPSPFLSSSWFPGNGVI